MKGKKGQEKSGRKIEGNKEKIKTQKCEDGKFWEVIVKEGREQQSDEGEDEGRVNKSTVGMEELHEDYAGVMSSDHPPFCHSMMKRYGQRFKGNSRRGFLGPKRGRTPFKKRWQKAARGRGWGGVGNTGSASRALLLS
jgi:hypothetical protein